MAILNLSTKYGFIIYNSNLIPKAKKIMASYINTYMYIILYTKGEKKMMTPCAIIKHILLLKIDYNWRKKQRERKRETERMHVNKASFSVQHQPKLLSLCLRKDCERRKTLSIY